MLVFFNVLLLSGSHVPWPLMFNMYEWCCQPGKSIHRIAPPICATPPPIDLDEISWSQPSPISGSIDHVLPSFFLNSSYTSVLYFLSICFTRRVVFGASIGPSNRSYRPSWSVRRQFVLILSTILFILLYIEFRRARGAIAELQVRNPSKLPKPILIDRHLNDR